MTEPSRAVFLSYASEDAQAAARMCQSLREAGIEVWFDQSELRGGDAWDSQIRRQIRDCALFIAVISAHTQARAEGYFRLEWSLADQRSHMIARSKAFIVPVCIDATREVEAEVPDAFLKVQWTRLPRGETPAAFCARVQSLLGGKGLPGPSPPTAPAGLLPAPPRRGWRLPALVAAAVVVVAALAWLAWRKLEPGAGSPASAPVAATGAAPAPAVPARSVAVLPFVNMSPDKDQEYFADGLSEELIDHLARIPSLKVIARTSSFAFKGRNEDVRTIAAKLGVANLLEGSVRKAGNELRITAQLIRASDSFHLWSQTYERKLTDIFRIQDEISTTVARALNAAIEAQARSAAARPGNIEAYNMVLRGNYFLARSNREDTARALSYYKQSIDLDHDYALAWVGLSNAYAQTADHGWGAATDLYDRARDAAEQAARIAPDLARVHVNLGWVRANIDWDWKAARAEFERARSLDPGDPYVARGLAYVTNTIYGRLEPEIALRKQELARNPLDTHQLEFLAYLLQSTGQLQESAATFRNLLQLNPGVSGGYAGLGVTLLLMGRFDDALAATYKDADETYRLAILPLVYWAQHRRAESDAVTRKAEAALESSGPYLVAQIHAYRGEADPTFEWLERAYRMRDVSIVLIRSDPLLRGLHGDPRYRAIIEKLKLADG